MSLSKRTADIKSLEYTTENQESILCENCGKFFQHKSSFNRHIQQSHSDLGKYECKQCSRTFTRLDNIRRHVKNIHSDALGPSIKRTFPTLSASPPPRKTLKLTTKPYYTEPHSSSSYVYQQMLKGSQKPMKWVLTDIEIPPQRVISHSYPRIRDYELKNKPRIIPTEVKELAPSHYSTVFPPPLVEDLRLFTSPNKLQATYTTETVELIDKLLQATLLSNKDDTPPSTPTPSPTLELLPDHYDDWLILDSIGRIDTFEEN